MVHIHVHVHHPMYKGSFWVTVSWSHTETLKQFVKSGHMRSTSKESQQITKHDGST